MVPVTRIRSPAARPESGTTRSVRPTPVVLRTMPSISPRPITLVSPVTIAAPASRQVSRIEAWMRSRSARGKPSSMTAAQVRASTSVAPIIARSLTVPETERRPMSPPGKKMGWTTCESVVTTRYRSPSQSAAPSSIASAPIPLKASGGAGISFRNTSSIRARIARPPAPCFRVTRSSRIVSIFTGLLRGWECRRTGARSCRCPRSRPCRRRRGCPARTRVRRGCSRSGTRSPT